MNSLSPIAMALHLHAPIEIEAPGIPKPGIDGAPLPPRADGSGDAFRAAMDAGLRRFLAAGALFAGDAAIYLGVWAALIPVGSAEDPMLRAFALITAVTLALFWSQELYPGYRLHGYELLRRRCTVTLRVGAVACAGAMLLTEGWHAPLLIVLFLSAALAAQPLMRSFVRGLLWGSGSWGERAVIHGEPGVVAELGDYFSLHWQYGIRPQPADSAAAAASLALIAGVPSRQEVERLRLRYAEVILLADFPGLPISGLRPSEIGGAIGLRLGGAAEPSAPGEALHRAFDLLAAGCAAGMVLPALLAAAAAIYVVDPGPVIYRQTREGHRGRPFPVLKLRTMYRDADERLEALLAADPEARSEWITHFKLRNDPRILPWISGFLRATSLDELPQLFNVLAGDMRLVGPRPFPIYHLAAMDAPFRVRRRSVMPGLADLRAQRGRSASPAPAGRILHREPVLLVRHACAAEDGARGRPRRRSLLSVSPFP